MSERIVCCIGDIHGYFSKLQALWNNLQEAIDPISFRTAFIIFLGDYCDRGPDTKKETWKEYEQNEEREGWFKGLGYENMHVQGRRWGGFIKDRFNVKKGTNYQGSIYDAAPTFESYGVPHGSADLCSAVPEEHKKFLSNLVWIHEEDNVWIEQSEGKLCCRLIAVHAGLEKTKAIDEQIKILRSKDTSVPKIEALSGRRNVWEIPKVLCENPTIVVSGHHGDLHVNGLRLIIDEGGGLPHLPVAAVILPSLKIVRS